MLEQFPSRRLWLGVVLPVAFLAVGVCGFLLVTRFHWFQPIVLLSFARVPTQATNQEGQFEVYEAVSILYIAQSRILGWTYGDAATMTFQRTVPSEEERSVLLKSSKVLWSEALLPSDENGFAVFELTPWDEQFRIDQAYQSAELQALPTWRMSRSVLEEFSNDRSVEEWTPESFESWMKAKGYAK